MGAPDSRGSQLPLPEEPVDRLGGQLKVVGDRLWGHDVTDSGMVHGHEYCQLRRDLARMVMTVDDLTLSATALQRPTLNRRPEVSL